MKKAQKGNDKAFFKIFQQYEEDMYRMAFLYVKNENDALDVVQEVAYQAFKNIQTLKNPAYFKTWLIRITMNCAMNLVGKNKKVIHLTPEQGTLIPSEEEDVPLSLTLESLMNVLEENEKSIVYLRFYQQYTFKEIAEILDIPLGTSKSILYRALEKLRKELTEVDFYEL